MDITFFVISIEKGNLPISYATQPKKHTMAKVMNKYDEWRIVKGERLAAIFYLHKAIFRKSERILLKAN